MISGFWAFPLLFMLVFALWSIADKLERIAKALETRNDVL